MKTVKVKGIGVQVQGISYFKNDVFDVSEDNYETIKEFVEVLEEDKVCEDTRCVVIKESKRNIYVGKEMDLKEIEKYLYECLNNFGKVQEDPEDSTGDDEELEALKDRAKELDIKITSNMKKETIIKKIEEAEKIKEEQNQNPDEAKDGSDTNVGNNGESKPQE